MLLTWYKAKRAEMEARLLTARCLTEAMTGVSSELQRDLAYHRDTGWDAGQDYVAVKPGDHYRLQENAFRAYYDIPWARAIIKNLTNFTIGSEFTVQIGSPADDAKQQVWDEWAEETNFHLLMHEAVERTFRDGEVFLRRLHDPSPEYRFIRAGLIKDPEGKDSYGIRTDPKDVSKVLAYHVMLENGSAEIEGSPLAAEEIWHMKINADSEHKRGVTCLKSLTRFLPQLPELMEARLRMHRVRTAVAEVRRVLGGPAQVAAVQAAQRKETGDTTDTTRVKMRKTGTIEYLTEGVDIEYKSPNIQAGDAKDDLRWFALALVAGSELAEYMVTGDASNANYSSTMVAESPAVRAFQYYQSFFGRHIKREVRWILKLDKKVPITIGFPPIIVRNWPAEADAYSKLAMAGLVSAETVHERLGFDPKIEAERLGLDQHEEPLAGED